MFKFKRKNIFQIPLYISNPKTKTPEEYMACFSSLFLDHVLNDVKNRRYDPDFYDDATKVVAKVLKEKYKIKSRKEREKLVESTKQEIFDTESEEEKKEKMSFYIG